MMKYGRLMLLNKTKSWLCEHNYHKWKLCCEKWEWDGYTSGGRYYDKCEWCGEEQSTYYRYKL
jgi:hypothetical protein